jgi:hypothetical protein
MDRNPATFSLDWISSTTSVARARRGALRRGRVALASVALAVGGAHVVAAQAAAPDTARHRLRFNAPTLHSAQYVYQMTLERDAGTTIVGTRTLTVSLSNYAGTPAWLLLDTKQFDSLSVDTDTLFVDLTALTPLHLSSRVNTSRLALEFRGDTAFGGTSGPPGRRSIVAPVPSVTFVNSAMLETVLRLLPLSPSWEDSAMTFTASLGANATVPTRLSVIGEDHLQLPAGTFDCWVVAVHAGDTARGMYWVTKQDPFVVRSAIDLPTMGGAQLVSALTRIGR